MAVLNDIIEARTYCVLGDQLAINVRHYLVTALTGTGATDSEIADAVSLNVEGEYRAVLNENARYHGASVQNLSVVPIGSTTYSAEGAGDGLTVGDPLPTQICGMLSIKTALGRQANRGRLYIPFPSEAFNEDTGRPTPAYLVLLDILALAWSINVTAGVGLNTNVLTPVLYHRGPGTSTPITRIGFVNRWGTQRRRGSYGKTNSSPI